MSDPLSKPIRRNLIEAITKDPRTIRQLEDMSLDVSENLPALIEEASLAASAADSLAQYGASVAQKALNEVQLPQGIPPGLIDSYIAELKKSISDDLTGQIAQLFAEVATLRKSGGGMQIKRRFEAEIDLANVTSNTYTISPAVNVDKTLIFNLGASTGASLNIAQLTYKIELTNSTTITATRGAINAQPYPIRFQVVEFT